MGLAVQDIHIQKFGIWNMINELIDEPVFYFKGLLVSWGCFKDDTLWEN